MRVIRIKQRFLGLIRTGEKTLEVRVAYDNIRTIQPGERIRLTSGRETQVIQVVDVRRYPSFDEMLAHEESAKIMPGLMADRVLSLLREIYPPEREELGVVVLQVRTEKPDILRL